MVGRKASQQPEYLEDGFDAAKLTKPQLRSILAEHGVMDLPPAAARKEALLELFTQHVAGRAGAIKRARSQVRASDKGIAFLDERSQPSPKRSPGAEGRPKRGRPRSSKKGTDDGEGEEQGPLKSPTRRRSPGGRGASTANESPSPQPWEEHVAIPQSCSQSHPQPCARPRSREATSRQEEPDCS